MSDAKRTGGGGKKEQNMAKPKLKPEPAASASTSAPKPDAGDEAPKLTKAEMKRLRREQQEAQRAAKAAGKANMPAAAGDKVQPKQPKEEAPKKSGKAKVGEQKLPPPEKVKKAEIQVVTRVPDQSSTDLEKLPKLIDRRSQRPHGSRSQRPTGQKKFLFSHLTQFVKEQTLTAEYQFNSSNIHPTILALGIQYAQGSICGSNARCVALLASLKQLIRDYSTPNHKDLARDLNARLRPNITFLRQCRPLSVSMRNAIKHLKRYINQVPSDQPEQKAKNHLFEVIDKFVEENIVLAAKAISNELQQKQKIQDGDVLMIYGYSSLIKYVLCEAHKQEIKFRVIIADSRPKLEGQEMLKQLLRAGIECSYVYITATSYVMQEVTKVLLGAHALLSNGFVMSRVGTSQVALVAKAYNVPVLVCCETYKFSDTALTDSFVFNELADPTDLINIKSNQYLNDWESMKSLNLLNLVYDVTPPDLVTVVVTEIGMIPCTSVPVVIRLKALGTQD